MAEGDGATPDPPEKQILRQPARLRRTCFSLPYHSLSSAAMADPQSIGPTLTPPVNSPGSSFSTTTASPGLERKLGAIHVLQSVEAYFHDGGASCKLNTSSFTVDITANISDANLKSESQNFDGLASCDDVHEASQSSCLNLLSNNLSFRVSVFQQTPGALLVKGSMHHRDSQVSGAFSTIFHRFEEVLFNREKKYNSSSSIYMVA